MYKLELTINKDGKLIKQTFECKTQDEAYIKGFEVSMKSMVLGMKVINPVKKVG